MEMDTIWVTRNDYALAPVQVWLSGRQPELIDGIWHSDNDAESCRRFHLVELLDLQPGDCVEFRRVDTDQQLVPLARVLEIVDAEIECCIERRRSRDRSVAQHGAFGRI